MKKSQMSKPLVSVVIPTYNRSKILLRAIDSVLQQTYLNIEIIVIDDGSTDDTYERVEKLVDSGKIRYYKIKNSGVCIARNFGIEKAKGDYISLLDSDDEYLADRIEKQLGVMKRENLQMSLSNRSVCVDGVLKRGKNIPNFYINDYKVLLSGIPLSATLMMFSKEIYPKVSFDKLLQSGNDLDFVANALYESKILFIGEPLNIINKSMKYSRISTDYTKKIQGYKRILKKIDKQDYTKMPHMEYFKGQVMYNLGMFYLFDGQFVNAQSTLRQLKKIKGISSLRIYLSSFLLLISKFPPLFNIVFSIAKTLWKYGLI